MSEYYVSGEWTITPGNDATIAIDELYEQIVEGHQDGDWRYSHATCSDGVITINWDGDDHGYAYGVSIFEEIDDLFAFCHKNGFLVNGEVSYDGDDEGWIVADGTYREDVSPDELFQRMKDERKAVKELYRKIASAYIHGGPNADKKLLEKADFLKSIMINIMGISKEEINDIVIEEEA